MVMDKSLNGSNWRRVGGRGRGILNVIVLPRVDSDRSQPELRTHLFFSHLSSGSLLNHPWSTLLCLRPDRVRNVQHKLWDGQVVRDVWEGTSGAVDQAHVSERVSVSTVLSGSVGDL